MGPARKRLGPGCRQLPVHATRAGAGTSDALTGAAKSCSTQTTTLLLGGQAARKQFHMGGLQELDHVSITKPLTKFSSSTLDTERIPELIGLAVREAYNG